MNKQEIICIISDVKKEHKAMLNALDGDRYALGYQQALNDIRDMIDANPSYCPTYEAERERLIDYIRKLKAKNKKQNRRIRNLENVIFRIIININVAELLSRMAKSRKRNKKKAR